MMKPGQWHRLRALDARLGPRSVSADSWRLRSYSRPARRSMLRWGGGGFLDRCPVAAKRRDGDCRRPRPVLASTWCEPAKELVGAQRRTHDASHR
jgi:hypothetical protein